jgi:hypothetical protein
MAKGSVERLKQLKHIATENIRSWMRERKFAEWMALPPLQIHIRHLKTSCDKVNDMGLTVVAIAYCPSQSPDDERNWCSSLLFEWNLNNEGTQAKILAGKTSSSLTTRKRKSLVSWNPFLSLRLVYATVTPFVDTI